MVRVLTFVIVVSLSLIEVQAESAREYFKYAKFSLDARDYDKALDYINKAIDVEPNYVNGILLRAEINFSLSEFEKVIADITRAFSLDPQANSTMADFHLLRGSAYLKVNNPSNALKDINFSIGINPNNAQAYYLKGLINTQNSIYFEAVENFDQAIKLDADVSEYYYKRAELKKLYYKPLPGTKEYKSIMTDIQIAINLNPDDFRPYELKCDMLKLDPSYSKVDFISVMDNIIVSFPEQANFYGERGMARVLSDQYGAALSDFTQAIQLDVNNEANYRNRGLCFHNMRKYQLALNDYSKSIDILIKKYQVSTEDESLKRILAQTFNMRGMTNQLNGNPDLACDDFYKAAKLGSKSGLNNYRRSCNVYN